jgi:polyhydroxybutyrate depolymerase
LPHEAQNDETRVERSVYRAGPLGAEVRAYRILGGGHTWPGGFQYLGVWIIGRTNRDIDADEELWNFFRRFHR